MEGKSVLSSVTVLPLKPAQINAPPIDARGSAGLETFYSKSLLYKHFR
jgi:hypothetical protein